MKSHLDRSTSVGGRYFNLLEDDDEIILLLLLFFPRGLSRQEVEMEVVLDSGSQQKPTHAHMILERNFTLFQNAI